MNNKYLNRFLVYYSPFPKSPLTFIGLSCLCLAIANCQIQTRDISLTSGSDGSAYQQISEQIIDSARERGNLHLRDDYNSQGSQENLERLLNLETDFALVQLDVASQAMKEGQVQAVVVLAHEYVHIITRIEAAGLSLADLAGKPVVLGAEGSGSYFTAKRLLEASDLELLEVSSSLARAFTQLLKGEVAALVHVGPLPAHQQVKTELASDEQLYLRGLTEKMINYLTINFPESYQKASIPQGSYRITPSEPRQDLLTISTATALVTRPDVDDDTVALLAWSIISTARQYAQFYPELASSEDPKPYLLKGLFHLHPGTVKAMEFGTPRGAWLRYLQNNKPLQAATIMLLLTTTLGLSLQWWRKRHSAEIIKSSRRQSLLELRSLMEQSPQQALAQIEQLRQQQRLLLMDNSLTPEVYEELEKMTRVLADECRTWQTRQEHQFAQDTLKLIENWQVMLRQEPQVALKQIDQVEQQLKTMLLAHELDIQTYLLIKQLMLILIICFVPSTLLTENDHR